MTASTQPTTTLTAGAAGCLLLYSAALPLGTRVRDVFRLGARYERAARNGEAAILVDLCDRHGIVAGAALRSEVSVLPEVGTTVVVEGVLIPTVAGPNAVWVKSIEEVEVLDELTCVFDKVMPEWVVDPAVLARAAAVWWQLSPGYRVLVNAVFRRASVLQRFLIVPASLDDHHNVDGGTLQHSVRTAEWGLDLAAENSWLAMNILVVSLLLHDCGKALEYRRTRRGKWMMSATGRGVGHKMTTMMLIGPALGLSPLLSGPERQQILHVLAASYAPRFAGFRWPRSAEARIVAAADRLDAEVWHRR